VKDITPKECPPLYANEGKSSTTTMVPVKLFLPGTGWTWYITEYSPQQDTAFGWVDGLEAELGYISLPELRDIRTPEGFAVERDTHWNPDTSLAEVMSSSWEARTR